MFKNLEEIEYTLLADRQRELCSHPLWYMVVDERVSPLAHWQAGSIEKYNRSTTTLMPKSMSSAWSEKAGANDSTEREKEVRDELVDGI